MTKDDLVIRYFELTDNWEYWQENTDYDGEMMMLMLCSVFEQKKDKDFVFPPTREQLNAILQSGAGRDREPKQSEGS
jgi:hypothetical protein